MFHQLNKTTSRRVLALAGVIAVTAGLAACAPASEPSAEPSSDAAGTCGTVPQIGAIDPDNLLAGFDDDTVANFNGFSTAIQASAWADWKPSGDGPYTAALITTPPSNPFEVTLTGAIRDELESAGIDLIFDQAAAGFTDVPQQLQLLDQAIALKPDIILFQPLASGAAIDAVNAAGEAGIPVVGVATAIDSEYSVSVSNNNTAQGAILAAAVFKEMGGSGTVLRVRGIPGIQADTDAQAGLDAALAECPDITLAGEVAGNYQNSLAQAAVLQFLATNPAGVDAVFHSGTMGLGILQAFEQSGREPALMADLGSSRGAIVYATEHPDYQYFGSSAADAAFGTSIAQVAIRMLAGQGPKLNLVVKTPEIITNDNLADAFDASWAADDATDAALKDDDFLTGAALDVYFTNPDLEL